MTIFSERLSVGILLVLGFGLLDSGAQLAEEIEEVVPFGGSWEYLFYWDTDGGIWRPHDPAEVDPDFHTTWAGGGAAYDGPGFIGPRLSPFGYGGVAGIPNPSGIWLDQDGGRIPPTGFRYTAYFKTTFTPTENANALRFEGIVDDGAIFYLDGVEVGRTDSMPIGVESKWKLLAETPASESIPVAVFVDDLTLEPGVPVAVAVSLHNVDPTSSDLGMDLRIMTGIAPENNPPENDDFANAEVITGQLPQNRTGRTNDTFDGIGATREDSEPLHAGQLGVGSVWYSYTPEFGTFVSVNAGDNRTTPPTNFSCLIAIYTGDALDDLVEVASSAGGDVLRGNTEVSFQAAGGTTYWFAVDGADNGGAPVEGENFGHLSLTVAKGIPQPFTPIERLLDARSEWQYLLVAEDDPTDPARPNQPVDPAWFGDGDPDFHETWHTLAAYDGPPFAELLPAPFWYGVITSVPVATNIWRERDTDGNPATPNLVPPTGLRYASYFRTTFTPANEVPHLGFRGFIDDAAVIFVNGVRVSAINFIGDVSDWQALAISPWLNGVATEVVPQYGLAPNVDLPAGVEVEIAVTVRNNLNNSSDMAFDLEVYSIEEPRLNSEALTVSNPVGIRFDSATPGDDHGEGIGSVDNLDWSAATGRAADEATLPNPPPPPFPGHALHSSGSGILMHTGVVDLQLVDNTEVVASIDFRTVREPEEGGFGEFEYMEASLEGSSDGFLFDRVATLIPRIERTGIADDPLKNFELPGGAYTTFLSADGAIPETVRFVRVVVRSLVFDEFEHLFIDDIRFTAGSPRFEADVIHDSESGENHIRWASDSVSLHEVFFSPDLMDWIQIDNDPGLRSTTHTPPADVGRGYYRVRRTEVPQ